METKLFLINEKHLKNQGLIAAGDEESAVEIFKNEVKGKVHSIRLMDEKEHVRLKVNGRKPRVVSAGDFLNELLSAGSLPCWVSLD